MSEFAMDPFAIITDGEEIKKKIETAEAREHDTETGAVLRLAHRLIVALEGRLAKTKENAAEFSAQLAEERERHRWVSVKDRLPEPKTCVLVVSLGWKTNHNNIYIGELKPVKADETDKWNFGGVRTPGSEWTIYGWSYLKAPAVTHWMPLPELPEED